MFEISLELCCLIMKQFLFCYQFEPQYYANCLVIFRLYSFQHMLANPTPRQVDAMFPFCFLADVFTATNLFLLLPQSTSISEGMHMRTAVLFLSLYQTIVDSLVLLSFLMPFVSCAMSDCKRSSSTNILYFPFACG